MKPWPKELAALYPLPLGVIPERPWWQICVNGTNQIEGLRSDLWRLTHKSRITTGNNRVKSGFAQSLIAPPNISMPPDFHVDLKKPVGVILAQVDESFPLPHPGFRVGQVWATPQEADEFLVRVIQAQDTGSVLRHWYMDFWHSEEELQSELRESYLLTDPCCPWLAPWSPS